MRALIYVGLGILLVIGAGMVLADHDPMFKAAVMQYFEG